MFKVITIPQKGSLVNKQNSQAVLVNQTIQFNDVKYVPTYSQNVIDEIDSFAVIEVDANGGEIGVIQNISITIKNVTPSATNFTVACQLMEQRQIAKFSNEFDSNTSTPEGTTKTYIEILSMPNCKVFYNSIEKTLPFKFLVANEHLLEIEPTVNNQQIVGQYRIENDQQEINGNQISSNNYNLIIQAGTLNYSCANGNLQDGVCVIETRTPACQDGYEYFNDGKCLCKKESIVNNETDIFFLLDISGSYSNTGLTQTRQLITDWVNNLRAANPNWVGNHYIIGNTAQGDDYQGTSDERFLKMYKDSLNTHYSNTLLGKDVLLITFMNEAGPLYHSSVSFWDVVTNGTGVISPTTTYLQDYVDFKSWYDSAGFNSFQSIVYPIVPISATSVNVYWDFIAFCMRAINSGSFTQSDVDQYTRNPAISQVEWDKLYNRLGNDNFPIDGLESMGFSMKSNKNWDGTNITITPQEFQADVESLLLGVESITTTPVNCNCGDVDESTSECVEVSTEEPTITFIPYS